MSNTINRRDFLGGTALVIAAGLTPLAQMRAEVGRYYPPSLTGLRGSHPGSFEVAHQVGREGKSFDISGLAVEQSFDLVVVGGGISGLAAAWFYREAHGPASRILILENHDDFGGTPSAMNFELAIACCSGTAGPSHCNRPRLCSARQSTGCSTRWASTSSALTRPLTASCTDRSASLRACISIAIARLLVRSMIPTAAPGRTMGDVVLADFNYAKLDVDGAPIRLRLNSTAVAVANARTRGGPVDIGYVRAGALHRVQAKQCVLACYNMIIPHIMPELPDAQKQALALSVKMPLVYVNVAIRNWHAFVKLGVDNIYSPYAYFSNTKLDYPVALGGYRNPRDPSEPILLHMEHIPLTPNQGLSNVEQFRLGRQLLLSTPFSDYETRITDQLDRMLGPGGFQSARDIAAITVNRWPHGYAYSADSLFDREVQGPPPYEIARKRRGSVTIANSDAAWNSYTHEAIDQAWRAVNELKSV